MFLNSSIIRQIPAREALADYSILSFSNRRRPQTWARLQGPGKRYRGDIGLLIEKSKVFPGSVSDDDDDSDNNNDADDKKTKKIPRLSLLILPRMSLYSTVDRTPASALQVNELRVRPGVSIDIDSYGNFYFEKKCFTSDGFWIADLEDIDLFPEYNTLPTANELDKFKECRLLESDTYRKTAKKISQKSMQCHQRVKIIDGAYSGIQCEILYIQGDEAEVYIPSEDCTERIALGGLRMHFEIGDAVRVLAGEHKNLAGWVVAVDHGKAIIVRMGNMIEVNALFDTIYFETDCWITGRSKLILSVWNFISYRLY